MAYDLQLVQINTSVYGLSVASAGLGFPTNTNFRYLLASYWMCGPAAGVGFTGAPGMWPAFATAGFFDFIIGTNGIAFSNQSTGNFFHGTFSLPPPLGRLVHLMLSVDTVAQIVQVYINDQNVPVTGATWTGTPPFYFNIPSALGAWRWDVSGVLLSSQVPALADVWMASPPSFVDLSVTANRRKFINRDLTAVDLGDAGLAPFGYQPPLYMSVRSGGVPSDIAINRGTGGGVWNFTGGSTPTFQAPGACSLPPAPAVRLAMDNVVATATATLLSQNLISLRWSNDRGHSWGSPVMQPIGDIGEYQVSLQWQRMGYSRDRCFELSWSVPMATALQGCWLTAESADADAPEQGGQSQGG